MGKQEDFNQEDYSWLVGVPVSDVNFKEALDRADAATIKEAVKHFEEVRGGKTVLLALRRRLRQLTVLGDEHSASDQDIIATANRQERTTGLELATLQGERAIEDSRAAAQIEREAQIAHSYELAGRVKALLFTEKVATVATLMQLKQAKESKCYRDLPGIGSWDKYCEYMGVSRRKVDEDLINLSTFGGEFLETVSSFSLGYRELKKLRQLTHDGSVVIEAECIRIGEESIPINEDHADDLQIAIEKIIEEKGKLHERVEKLEKNLDAVVKEETKGLLIEKKLMKKEIDRLKAFDPEGMDPTRFKEQFKVIHETMAALASQIGKLVIIEGLESDPHLAAQVEGFVASAEQLTRGLRQQWEEKFNIYA
jgi:hypothetical protein